MNMFVNILTQHELLLRSRMKAGYTHYINLFTRTLLLMTHNHPWNCPRHPIALGLMTERPTSRRICAEHARR